MFDKIEVVLVEPAMAGNIGSVARALKTMGFHRLTLVSPLHHTEPQAQWMAAHAGDILASARVVQTLDEALEDSHLAIALTARTRRVGPQPLSIRSACPALLSFLEQDSVQRVSLVFGSERTGLENHHIDRCQQLWTIPADPAYGVLNLAQAVQIVLYECRSQYMESQASGKEPPEEQCPPEAWPTHQDYEALYAHFEAVLLETGYLNPKAPRQLLRHLRRLFGRAQLNRSEIDLLRGILRSVQESR